MLKLSVRINNDLVFTTDGTIQIKINPSVNNAITIDNTGLFFSRDDIVSFMALQPQSHGGIRVGYRGPFDSTIGDVGVLSANNIIHRIYTVDTHGSYVDYRAIDCILPGDFIRVDQGDDTFEYRLVTNTTIGQESNGFLNNAVSTYEVLGTW